MIPRDQLVNRALLNKCERLRAKDMEWARLLPPGWFRAVDAMSAWGVCRQETRKRLELMKDSGILEQRGSSVQSVWRVVPA